MTPVQSSGKVESSSTSSTTVALAGSATAGNLLVLVVTMADNTASTALATPAGWSVAFSPTGTKVGAVSTWMKCAIFYKENCGTGTNSTTVNGGANSFWDSTMTEWAITGTGNIDQTQTNGNGTGTFTSGDTGTTLTTAQASELAISAIGVGSNDTPTGISALSTPATVTGGSPTGTTSIATNADDATTIAFSHTYSTLTATGTIKGAWTWSTTGTSVGYAGGIATFKIPAATTRPVKMAGEWGGYAGSSGGFAG